MKYKQIEIEALPSVSEEEFDALPKSEKQDYVMRAIKSLKYRLFVMSLSLIKFGEHEASCTDENTCTCGLTPIQDIALGIVDSMENDPGFKDVSVN